MVASGDFVPNAGQFHPQVLFQSNGTDAKVAFTDNEIVLMLAPAELLALKNDAALANNDVLRARCVAEALKNPHPVARLKFQGTNNKFTAVGVDQHEEKVNYLIGDDSSKWQTNLPTYGGIVYQQIYSGVDLRYDSIQQGIKGTYTITPNSNPAQIRWRYTGVKRVDVDASGNLVIPLAPASGKATEDRQLVEQAPVAWQDINGQRVSVDVRYIVDANGSIGFALGAYDQNNALTIDPIITYSTYLGGSTYDEARAIAVDGSQRIYITGYTDSTSFPGSGYDTTYNGGVYDAFVTKYDNNTRVFSTYYGGNGDDFGSGIAVDSSGNVHVAGGTTSTNLPVPGGTKTSHTNPDDQDAFVMKLSSNGTSLLYGTYFGGNSDDVALGLAQRDTTTYVVGNTNGNGFTTKNAQDSSYNGGTDAFLARFNLGSTGSSSLLSSTYFGGSSSDSAYGVTVDGSNIYIVGSTASSPSSFPETSNAYDKTYGGSTDAFVAQFNSSASSLSYASYLGGSGFDEGYGIATNQRKGVFVTGYTTSTTPSFPMVKADDSSYNGSGDAFVAGFNLAAGVSGSNTLTYTTYLGGSGTDYGKSIAAEGDGRVTVTGYTSSSNFRIQSAGPMQSSSGGSTDAFVTRLDKLGMSTQIPVMHSSYLGGAGADYGQGVALDTEGRIYVTGYTYSLNFPVTFTLPPSTNAGSADVFVTKAFPEYTYSGCRWPHTAGTTTTITYQWGNGLQTTGPGTWRTDAFEPAINSWNNLNNKIHFQYDSNGSILMRLDNNPNISAAGLATPTCSGSNTTAYDVMVNLAWQTQINLPLTVHEVGHSQGIGHISSFATTVMGTNETPATSTLQSMDDELVDTVYP